MAPGSTRTRCRAPTRSGAAAPPRGGNTAGTPGGADPDGKILRVADPRFGDVGQVALNGALSGSIGHLGYDSSDASSTNVSVEPAFDYFAAQNTSQGATAFFRYANSVSGNGVNVDATTVGVTGRLGQNVWLGGRVSFWPKLAVGVGTAGSITRPRATGSP